MTFKFLLTASVLGVISVVTSSAAFAIDQSSTFCKPGFYAGLQGGRSDTFYSGKSFVFAAAPTSSQAIVSNTLTTLVTTTTTSEAVGVQKTDDIGLGGRIYAGYQFNPYFALETGYTQYAKTTMNAGSATTTNINIVSFQNDDPSDTLVTNEDQTWTYRNKREITENAIDLVGKATLPLNYGFGLYGKAGVAYINANSHTKSELIQYTDDMQNSLPSLTTSNVSAQNTEYAKSYQAFRPTAGIGVNYTIPNSNISVDASYSRVFSSGAIPQASLLALGAEYKFG